MRSVPGDRPARAGRKFREESGQVATEFVLTLPFALALIVSFSVIAALGLRVILAQYQGARTARAAALSEQGVTELPRGLDDHVLRGGDTPSPYCVKDGGYQLCGYPE